MWLRVAFAFLAVANAACWVGNVATDMMKVWSHYRVVGGVEDERDDAASGPEDQVVPRKVEGEYALFSTKAYSLHTETI